MLQTVRYAIVDINKLNLLNFTGFQNQLVCLLFFSYLNY